MAALLFYLTLFLNKTILASTIDLASGSQKILPHHGGGTIVVSNPKCVKAIISGDKISLVGKQPGLSEITGLQRKSVTKIVVFNPKLIEAKNSVDQWLKRTINLHREMLPQKIVVHGMAMKLSDWAELQQLRQQYKNMIDVDAKISPNNRPLLVSAIRDDLRERSLNSARVESKGDKIVLLTYTKNPIETVALSEVADQWGVKISSPINDIELKPMVEIEIVIAEVKKNTLSSLGLQLPGTYSASILPAGDLSSATNTFNPIPIELHALDANNSGRVLANPKLLCRSGEVAHFVAGGQIPIKIISWKNSDVIWKPYGVILDITPLADSHDGISTKLVTEISLLDEAHKIDGIPALLTNRIETHFDIRGSKTIALSGLIKSEIGRAQTSTPFLSDIPILGELFKSKEYKDLRSELVVFVTPRVISPENPPTIKKPDIWKEDMSWMSQ